MERILNEFNPLKHRPIKDMEQVIDPVLFQVELSPLVNDLESLSLYWKTDTMPNFSKLPMDNIRDLIFQNQLDLKSFTGRVEYYFHMNYKELYSL